MTIKDLSPVSGGGINISYFYPPSPPPLLPVWLHRKGNQLLSFPHILLSTVLKHGTPERITCLFCINGYFLCLLICWNYAIISCPLFFSIITSQLSKCLQLIDALRFMFSTEGRDHLSEMSTLGSSVSFSMIRSCCCLGFVSPGSGSLQTDGWYSQITPQGVTSMLKYEMKWKKTGFYICIFPFYYCNFGIISAQISGRNCLQTCEITFLDLRGNMFKFFSVSVDGDVFWMAKLSSAES